MKLSPEGIDFLIHEEGEVLHIYKDQRGFDTIGIGHLLTAKDKAAKTFVHGITATQCRELFAHDVEWAVKDVNDAVKVPLTQHQFDALTSFTFNVGMQWIKHPKTGRPSSMLVLVNHQGYAGVPAKMAQWVFSAGVELPVLVARRKREGTLWGMP